MLDVDPQRLHDLCERYGVASLEVFGSHARGDAGPESDVDLLYVLKEGTRLGFRLFDLEDELTALLGTKVDLVARSGINEHLRPQILAGPIGELGKVTLCIDPALKPLMDR